MIKIAIIGHKHVPSYEGGIESVLTEMLPLIDKNKFRITIYNRWETFYKPSEWGEKEQYSGFKIIRIPTFKNNSLNALVYSFFASIHASFCDYDIIHYHAEGPAVMSFIPKLLLKKIVITNHGLDWLRGKWGGFATKYLKYGEKISTKTSDYLIVLSKAISDYFKETYNRDTIVIGNGIDSKDRIPSRLITEKFNLKGDDYILALGRIVPEKGFHYLIKAYNNLNIDKKLVIAGKLNDSEYCKELQQMASNNKNIMFADFVDGELKQELFSNCYIYVIPSDLEGMSISLLEALSYGCNCIASDIVDNRNIADDYITFFEKGNVNDLTKKLMDYKPKTEIEKQNQIMYIVNNYSWESIVRKTEEIYKKCIE